LAAEIADSLGIAKQILRRAIRVSKAQLAGILGCCERISEAPVLEVLQHGEVRDGPRNLGKSPQIAIPQTPAGRNQSCSGGLTTPIDKTTIVLLFGVKISSNATDTMINLAP